MGKLAERRLSRRGGATEGEEEKEKRTRGGRVDKHAPPAGHVPLPLPPARAEEKSHALKKCVKEGGEGTESIRLSPFEARGSARASRGVEKKQS